MAILLADKIKLVPIDTLVPYARNARTHSESQVEKLAESIRRFGLLRPIVVDGNNGILAGHGCVLALKRLGQAKVPTVDASHLGDNDRRAFVLADNRLAEMAGWDEELLRAELGALAAIGFDLKGVGLDIEIGGCEDSPRQAVVEEIDVSAVADKFWISVRGPLEQQAEALQRLRDLMRELPGVEVDLGTVQDFRL